MPTTASEESLPDLSELLDFRGNRPDVEASERPRETAIRLPPTLEEVAAQEKQDRLELSGWIRWLALMNLPPSYEDNRKWGKQKEVWDGVHLRMDGLRLDTKRKWKSVKHGTWSRYFIEFVDPEETLKIDVRKLELKENGRGFQAETLVTAYLRVFGRISEWRRDVQIMSLSGNAHAHVAMKVVCEVEVKLNPLRVPPDVELIPHVTSASVELLDLDVHNISQLHGPGAEMLGKGIKEVLDRRLEGYGDKLVEKMNASIDKQRSKLKLSFQDWFQSSLSRPAK